MPSYPGFLGPANKGQSYIADDEQLINWFLERNESASAPNPWCMLPCPGFNSLASVTETPGRGQFAQNGRAFFVEGTAFYELFIDNTTTLRGTVTADANPVTIHANGDAGNQLWMTSGGVGYVFDLTMNTLSVQGVAGTTVSMGGFSAARFLYLDATSGAFYASAQYDGTSWNALDVAQSQSGDPWRALIVTPDELIRLLGESSGEAWADQGAGGTFPFTKVSNASIPFGIVSPFAWAVDTVVTWVAQNSQGRGIVVRAPGYAPERISTHAIEATLGTVTDFAGTTAFKYQENGHSFFVLNVTELDRTFVYDNAAQLWHERAYWNTATGIYQSYRPNGMMSAFGKTIVLDRLSGAVYEMSTTFQSDVDGAVIRRVRQPPRVSFDQKRFTVHTLELVMDKGQGTATGQGVDPQMTVRVSKNGGKTFGNMRQCSIGEGGAYDTRVFWDRFGQGRNFVPQFIASDPAPYRITDCLIDVSVGTS